MRIRTAHSIVALSAIQVSQLLMHGHRLSCMQMMMCADTDGAKGNGVGLRGN